MSSVMRNSYVEPHAADSRVGEVMVLSVHPRYAFQHKDCGLAPPKGAPTNQTLRFTLELVQCFKKVRRSCPAGIA